MHCSMLLYSTSGPSEDEGLSPDANSYPPFRVVDSAVVTKIMHEFDSIQDADEQG